MASWALPATKPCRAIVLTWFDILGIPSDTRGCDGTCLVEAADRMSCARHLGLTKGA